MDGDSQLNPAAAALPLELEDVSITAEDDFGTEDHWWLRAPGEVAGDHRFLLRGSAPMTPEA